MCRWYMSFKRKNLDGSALFACGSRVFVASHLSPSPKMDNLSSHPG